MENCFPTLEQQFMQWFVDNCLPAVLSILSVIFGLVIMIVQLVKLHYSKNQAKERYMKYRTENYQSAKGFCPYAQSFKKIVPVYELDEKTNTLVVVGSKDLQELINSSRDCGLDVILEKYGALPPQLLPEVKEKTSEPFDATDLRDDLCILADFAEDIEDMRIRYGMPMASFDELQKHISALKCDVDKKIQDSLATQSKEVKTDEV